MVKSTKCRLLKNQGVPQPLYLQVYRLAVLEGRTQREVVADLKIGQFAKGPPGELFWLMHGVHIYAARRTTQSLAGNILRGDFPGGKNMEYAWRTIWDLGSELKPGTPRVHYPLERWVLPARAESPREARLSEVPSHDHE